jgi:cytochrome c oxidase assembly protein subunit 15
MLPPALTRLVPRLPATETPLIRRLAIASLVSQIVIVVTGGLVRLTSSGLGCPEWPKCTAESVVSTPELGLHGVIEFGNRLLTFVLVVIAVAMLVSLLNLRRQRRDLFRLAVALLAGIPAQAVIGGITVWTDLNPWVVGWHFLVSMALVAVATVLVARTRLSTAQSRARLPRAAPRVLRQLLTAAAVLTGLAVVLGVIVTGSGPHAGDHGAARNNLDPELMTRIHAAPVYLLVLTVAVAVALAFRHQVAPALRRALVIFAVAVLAQGAIGYTQHFLHLPVALVALHMLGASLLTAAAVHAVYAGFTRQPADAVARQELRTPVR